MQLPEEIDLAGIPSIQTRQVMPATPPDGQLIARMIDSGVTPPNTIIMDGAIHRFRSGGDKADKTGWYIAYSDGVPAGMFGDWRTGLEVTWRAETGREMSHEEYIANLNRMANAKRKRDEERAKASATAADTVSAIWEAGLDADPKHPYLVRKGISPHGAKATGDGRLMLPLLNTDGSLSSLQYIDEHGGKLYHPGGVTGGKFWMIGDMTTEGRLFVAEGFATAATIHEVTGRPCVVAYSASNLVPAVGAMRDIFGLGQEIIVVADNDASGVGQRYAEQASAKYGAEIIVPPDPGDANDYHLAGKDLSALLQPPAVGVLAAKMGMVYGSDLPDEYSPPDELVEGLLVSGSMAVVYGDSNSGKTFWSLSIAAAIAEGKPCYGRQTEKGVVIYLATEAPGSVRTRVQAIKRTTGWKLSNLAIVQVPLNFHNGDSDAIDVISLIREVEVNIGIKCKLIVGDTLARMSSGANENSGEDMAPVMARFEKVCRATGAALLLVHHCGKNAAAGARGWSGIRAHIDTEIEVAEINGARTATVTKQRELSSKGLVIKFALQVVPMGYGKFGSEATTCVAIDDSGRVEIDRKMSVKRTAMDAAIDDFRAAWLRYGRHDRDEIVLSRTSWMAFYREVDPDLSEDSIKKKFKRDPKRGICQLIDAEILTFENDFYTVKDDFLYSQIRLAANSL